MKIRITNRLIIKEPTDAIKAYCKNNLVLDNPDYYKKERMGKWTGGTPQKIWLYEDMGGDLWLPFGCLQDVWNMHQVKDDYTYEIKPVEPLYYQSGINLYPYQETAVAAAIKWKNGVLVMPCGSGKTQCGLEIIARIGGRALWLTHTKDLLNQSKSRAESVLLQGGYGTITAGKVDVGTHITFATVQTLAGLDLAQYRDTWDVIIVDECMPGNTLIDTPTGKKALKNLCIDDIITSYNRNERKIENKRITHIFKSKAHDIVKVKLSNGEEIICTKNHPIYTKSGQWIDAERLVHDDYVLRLVRKRSGDRCNAEVYEEQSFKKRVLLLFQRMLNKGRSQKGCVDGRSQESCIRNNEKNKQSVSRSVCGENENRQSHEKAGSSESSIRQTERNRTQTTGKMWKWRWFNSAATKFGNQISRFCGCLHRISNTNKNATREWLSDLLQGGHSDTRKNGGNRDRRQFSLYDRKTATGSEKRAIFEWVRVDSVEIQEQTSDGTFGGMCCDGYVYNIEVEDNNNYFANGVLVHNCQHCAGSPTRVTQFYKVVSRLSARYKIGLTATPKRADGLQAAMFAILGKKIHEVTKADVAHTTCPVKVVPIETGWMPDYDAVLMGDGQLDYNKLIDTMIHDDDRYEVVLKRLQDLKQPTMVLANRVEYLQRLCDDYNHLQYGTAVCLSGQRQNKKAKEERKMALTALNTGELDCIFCTYSLAAEGLDVPNLRYVVFATPEQNEVTVTQSVGRVGRKAEGKECGTVYDLIDDFGMYRGWAKKRAGYYKKIDAEVENE